MAHGTSTRTRTGRAGIAQLSKLAQAQAAERPTVPIPVITGSGSGHTEEPRPLPAPASGRAHRAASPLLCGPGTPGTGPGAPRCPAGRIAAAVLTAVQAGDLEAAAALITGLGPGREDVVCALAVSAAMAGGPRQ